MTMSVTVTMEDDSYENPTLVQDALRRVAHCRVSTQAFAVVLSMNNCVDTATWRRIVVMEFAEARLVVTVAPWACCFAGGAACEPAGPRPPVAAAARANPLGRGCGERQHAACGRRGQPAQHRHRHARRLGLPGRQIWTPSLAPVHFGGDVAWDLVRAVVWSTTASASLVAGVV